MKTFSMAEVVKDFVEAHNRLQKHYEASGLGFTLDGKLVGDLAEVIAAELFGLTLCERRTVGVDCHAKDGRSVQVKATGLPSKGPAFTPGEGRADHLVFLRLDFDSATGVIAYNGSEAPIRRLLPPTFTGTKRVRLAAVLTADASVARIRPTSTHSMSAGGHGAHRRLNAPAAPSTTSRRCLRPLRGR